MLKGTVTTNCEDDEFFRVKVKVPNVWPEESQLLPSLGNIYLEKGDIVLIEFDSLQNPIILGKVGVQEQNDNNPLGSDHVLFQAKKGSDWIVGTLVSNMLHIESSKGLKLETFFDSVVVTTPDGTIVEIKDNKVHVKTSGGGEVEVTGDVISKSSGGGEVDVKSLITIKNNSQNLKSIIDSILDAFTQNAPTTMGSPAAQNLNPAIIAKLTLAKTNLAALMQ